MKNSVLNLVVGTIFSMQATYAGATGLVAIPATGFSASAYTLCNTTGNFGSGITIAPTTSANNTCAAFPTNEAVSPVSGYTLIASMSRNAIINAHKHGSGLAFQHFYSTCYGIDHPQKTQAACNCGTSRLIFSLKVFSAIFRS